MSLKVLKFGGTSVGTVKSITALKDIVESEAQDSDIIVVVSALGGLTDKLIATAEMAKRGEVAYKGEIASMLIRHQDMVNEVIDENKRENLLNYIETLFVELSYEYDKVFSLHELSFEDLASIVSYGELLSSRLTATLIAGAEWKDSSQFVKTQTRHQKFSLCEEQTKKLVISAFSHLPHIVVCPGFIASDIESGKVTNLGRGGSDFTAAIFAAVLGADALEIWTDVDGFMTADPRIISDAHTIAEMSYSEAMELCNCGAKVIYPPTLYPVCQKKIPIFVKNTFNSLCPGTKIVNKLLVRSSSQNMFCGLSNMKGISLIFIEGPEMSVVHGLHRRIASCLLERGIEILFMDSISLQIVIAVHDSDCALSIASLHAEFENAIRNGRLHPVIARSGLAAATLVGENMSSAIGLQARVSSLLSNKDINLVFCHHGAEYNSFTFIVESSYMSQVLNILHQEFL